MKRIAITLLMLLPFYSTLIAQDGYQSKPSIGVVAIDVQGLQLDNLAMGNLVRLELEKTKRYEVLDKYDAAYVLKKNDFKPAESFGKRQLVEIGQLLEADKMLTGSAEKFGNKIIFILRLIDVASERIEKTSVKEYIYDEQYIQRMTRISVNDLLGIETNEHDVDVLVNFEKPITSSESTLKLNGPRFGMQFFSGDIAERLRAPKSEGGYNSDAFASVFAYQYEKQYISSGEFQALFEFIFGINGIESGYTTPSLTVLNGMRFRGWEIGFGPVFRLTKTAEGAFLEDGTWARREELTNPENYEIVQAIDSRGSVKFSTGLVFAAGKTFTSGYLNLPVNIYYSPTPQYGSGVFGFMLGFNIAKNR